MANVAVQKVEKVGPESLPIFETIEKRLDDVRRRAFELFEHRGYQLGHEIDDWIKAEHEIFGWPAAELAEKDGKYEAQMTLPGFEPNEVQVTATPSEVEIIEGQTSTPTRRPNLPSCIVIVTAKTVKSRQLLEKT